MDPEKKTIKKKKKKTTVITIRATENEKKRLEKKAVENNMNLSRFLISTSLTKNSKPQDKNITLVNIRNTVMVQQICNYISETYGEDRLLEEWSAGLWKNLL